MIAERVDKGMSPTEAFEEVQSIADKYYEEDEWYGRHYFDGYQKNYPTGSSAAIVPEFAPKTPAEMLLIGEIYFD